MYSRFVQIFICLALCSTSLSANPEELAIKGYSAAPIAGPIFEPADVVVRTVRLNNWLNGNVEKLKGERKKQIREHLYYLINSHIKHLSAEGKSIFPDEGDAILPVLFSWSERLGVYGGHLVHNELKIAEWERQSATNIFPNDWALSLNDGLFTLASKQGAWSASYPYYFMVADAQNFVNTEGMPTDLVSFSTGSAHHADGQGYSQATLMLIHSPEAMLTAFSDYWLKAIGVSGKITKLLDTDQNANSSYFFDKNSKLHKEIVTWQGSRGVFAVVYLGIDGSYQHNRQHFLDFIASVRTGG